MLACINNVSGAKGPKAMLGWEDGNPRRLVTGTGGKSYGSALGRLHGREPLEMKPADDGCIKVRRSQETKRALGSCVNKG